MPRMKNVAAKFERHPQYKVPRRIYDIDSTTKKKGASTRQTAAAFLKKIAKELGIKSDLSQLRFDKQKKTILGTHVFYQQYEEGKPISGAWIKIDLDHEGNVFNVTNDLVPMELLIRTRKLGMKRVVSVDDASDAALRSTGCHKPSRAAEVVETEQCFFAGENGPIPAWKIVLRAIKPVVEWKVYVDEGTGQVLSQVSLLKKANGSGQVFDPNPVVTLNDTNLKDSSGIPDAAYSKVELLGLKNNGKLDGKFVTTKNTSNRVHKPSRKFNYKRGQKGFNEVMIYFHIDRVQRYIQDLGFDNILNQDISVNALGGPADNSFYSPTTKSLTFGEGGVDDAEDADIILHEYGHAIQDDQVPGFGESHEGGSMGEGFGDYLAGSFFADQKSTVLRPCVGSWDAVSYSADDPPNLRRLDSNKKYPKDMVGEVHDDGEIWSACLWELRAAIGRRIADRLILAHHFLIKRDVDFEDGANALITADNQLNGGANKKVIRTIFIRRGIFKNPKRGNRRAGDNPFQRKK